MWKRDEAVKTTPVLLTLSDMHLSHTAPISRSTEPSWYEVMARQLDEVRELARRYKVPIACAGDIFHKYNPPPELVNFAIKALPKMYAVPGQHDLPNHVYADMHRSAYGCLVSAGIIEDLPPNVCIPIAEHVALWGYPWGTKVGFRPAFEGEFLHIAICHQYIWTRGKSFPGATKDSSVMSFKELARSWSALVFGDNHQRFVKSNVVNNGTFLRRNANEKDELPAVSLIYDDGTIETIELESARLDVFVDEDEALQLICRAFELVDFVGDLKSMRSEVVDFGELLIRYCNEQGIVDNIRRRLLEAIGK
jgi:hypothetical protein